MANVVVTGASLQCSMGESPATFSATGPKVSAAAAVGVTTDTAPQNIPPFGLCQSLQNPQVASASSAGPLVPQPCLPVITAPWSPASTKVTVGGVAAITDGSGCQCSWGGRVSINSAGQTKASLQ